MNSRSVPCSLRAQRLLAFLAVNGPRARTYVAATLWPELPQATASANLHAAISHIRRLCLPLVQIDPTEIALTETVSSDVAALRTRLRQISNGAWERRGAVTLQVVDRLAASELLPGWHEDWVLRERVRLRDDQLRGLRTLARTGLDTSRPQMTIAAASLAASLDPLSEDLLETLVTAQLAVGDLAGAAGTLRHYRLLLWTNSAFGRPLG